MGSLSPATPAFPWFKPMFPDNSALFWWVSSGICLVMALAHGWGAWRLL